MPTAQLPLKNTSLPMLGGVAASPGLGRVATVTVLGTFEPGDRFNLVVGEYNYGYLAKPTPPVTFLLTFNKKLYGIGDTLLQFSAINAPKDWDSEFGIGAGFINMFNEFTGGEKLKALAPYSGRMAIIARGSIQVWSMDVDPARNQQLQVLDKIGAIAARSVVQYGDVDVFLLADSGIRSLRSRDTNNVAFSSDVGNAIDTIVIDKIRELGPAAEDAIGTVEPTDGRYWLAMGDEIFVFSHFSGSNISAWTTYEPGFTVSDIATAEGRLWLRSSDNQLYLYGGDDNNTYDDCPMTGELPFLSMGTPATEKTFTAFDATVEGEFSFSLGTNPEAPSARDDIGTLWAPSFDMKRIPIEAVGTHFAINYECTKPGYARLSNMIIHYSPHEAG
jgi:hypothetical protein